MASNKITVLIVNINKNFFNELCGGLLVFRESTKNTSTFQLSREDFEELKDYIRLSGNNPYALMTWR